MKKILILGLLLFLSGCITMANTKPVMPIGERIDTFNIDQLQEKTIGESMVMKMNAASYPGFEAVSDYQIPGSFGTTYPAIKTGMQFFAMTTLENGDYLLRSTALGQPMIIGSGPAGYDYCLIANAAGEIIGDGSCVMAIRREWPEPVKNVFKPFKYYLEGGDKKELIYNGKSKDTIKLQYREYINDLARPAFFQELTYDLAESKVIGFKDMRIEVVEASNSSIKFIVKTGFN